MTDGDTALLHRSGSKRRETDHVARRVNMRNSGAIVFVHGDVATVVDREASFFQREAIYGSAASGGKQRCVGFEDFAALHGQPHATRRIF